MCSVLISGRPGIGKTTTVKRIAAEFGLPGIITEEIREGARRVGFRVVDLATGEERVLAHVSFQGPRVGKYGVDVSAAEWMAGRIERYAGDWFVLDEIGPMEMKSDAFVHAVDVALRGRVIATVHRSLADKLAREYNAPLLWLNSFDDQEEVIRRVGQMLSG